jgi:hypothetical protein
MYSAANGCGSLNRDAGIVKARDRVQPSADGEHDVATDLTIQQCRDRVAGT